MILICIFLSGTTHSIRIQISKDLTFDKTSELNSCCYPRCYILCFVFPIFIKNKNSVFFNQITTSSCEIQRFVAALQPGVAMPLPELGNDRFIFAV